MSKEEGQKKVKEEGQKIKNVKRELGNDPWKLSLNPGANLIKKLFLGDNLQKHHQAWKNTVLNSTLQLLLRDGISNLDNF